MGVYVMIVRIVSRARNSQRNTYLAHLHSCSPFPLSQVDDEEDVSGEGAIQRAYEWFVNACEWANTD